MKIDTNALIMAQVLCGGGSSVTVEPLSVTANGEYTAPTGKAYSPVTVNVSGSKPSYLISDGDTITNLYFNVGYNLDTYLAGLTYDETFPSPPLAYTTIYDGLLYAGDLSSVGLGSGYILYAYDGTNMVLLYSTIIFDASAYIPGFACTQTGWQLSSIALPASMTVDFGDIKPSFLEIIDYVETKTPIAFGQTYTTRRSVATSAGVSPTDSTPTTSSDISKFKAEASVEVPNDEIIVDVSYNAGFKGALRAPNGITVDPSAEWNATGNTVTVTKTKGATKTVVKVVKDDTTNSVLQTMLGLGCKSASYCSLVMLSVVSVK